MDHESSEIDSRAKLSARLLGPSAVLGLILMGLTLLPMSSCENREESFVPAQLALQFAGFHDNSPRPMHERIVRFVGSLPLLFLFTWPYWTSVPAVFTFLLLLRSKRWGTFLWRLLTLLLSCSLASFIFISDTWVGVVVGVGGAVAMFVWIRSSPSMAWLWKKLVTITTKRGSEKPLPAKQPVRGGFMTLAVLCVTALLYLACIRATLLVGGKLAAVTNLAMAVVAVVSAQQAAINSDRFPRFSIRDLLLTSLLLAISFWWFWI